MIRLLMAGALLVFSHHAAVTAERCLSITEARKLWPTAHLYWSSPASGRRCWSIKRGRSASFPVAHTPPPRPAPPRIDAPPSLMPPVWRDPEPPPPPSILDSPKWAWVTTARELNPTLGNLEFRLPSGTEVYSTFPGEQPEIWPPLEQRVNGVGVYGMAAILAILAAGAFWVVWGYRSRVRLEKPLTASYSRRRTIVWNGKHNSPLRRAV
jgi:hypothetical protein